MRENIGLFKAKRKSTKDWVTGYLYIKGRKAYIIVVSDNSESNKSIISEKFYLVDPETLCECAGLKDDSKKLIFEHDKLKDNKGQVGTVFYANGRYAVNWCGVDGEYFVDTCFYGKVIGNIFNGGNCDS